MLSLNSRSGVIDLSWTKAFIEVAVSAIGLLILSDENNYIVHVIISEAQIATQRVSVVTHFALRRQVRLAMILEDLQNKL
jgi:hypothetical protein